MRQEFYDALAATMDRAQRRAECGMPALENLKRSWAEMDAYHATAVCNAARRERLGIRLVRVDGKPVAKKRKALA